MRPQDDLYRYANGPWLEEHEIPADKAIYGAFHALWDTAEQDVRAIVEKTVAAGHPEGSEPRKIADLYSSFMDEETIERLGAEPIAEQLALVRGIEDLPGLVAALGQLELQGVPGVFHYWVDADAKKSDENIVYLTQGGLSLPDESYYREDSFAEVRTAYVAHVTRMLELAGLPDPAGAAERIMELETRVAGAHWDRVKNRDVQLTYNKVDRAGLEELTPGFDWSTLADGRRRTGERLRAGRRSRARLLHRGRRGLAGGRAGPVEGVAELADRAQRGAAAEQGLRRRELRLLRQDADRRARAARALEARRRRGRAALGEALGKLYVAEHFPPAAKARMVELVAEPARGVPAADRGAGLDGPGDPAAGARQARRRSRRRSATRTSGATTAALEVDPADLFGNVRRRSRWRPRGTWPSSASRSTGPSGA